MTEEAPKIRKSTAVLLDAFYQHPQTNLLQFHFDPYPFEGAEKRMKEARVEHKAIGGKDLYVIDGLFSKEEADEMRAFSKSASFSLNVYGNHESEKQGQKPARAMNNKERWLFFNRPPKAVQELYKWFSYLAHALDAEISTLPWDLCHQATSTTAVSTNFVEEVSPESMELGRHEDYKPAEGLSFGVPILYDAEKRFHMGNFVNGSTGRPWMVSAMLYSTSEDFLPAFGMGTVFYEREETIAFRADCLPMRLVLFEGDIPHSIEQSQVPLGTKASRVSYVFKLLFNPREKGQSIKNAFFHQVLR